MRPHHDGIGDARAVMQDQFDVGQIAAKLRKARHQSTGPENWPDSKGHCLASALAVHFDLSPDIIKRFGQNAAQGSPLVGQYNGPRLADKQLAAPIPLQLADLITHGCRTDAKLLSGVLEAKPPRSNLEGAQGCQWQFPWRASHV